MAVPVGGEMVVRAVVLGRVVMVLAVVIAVVAVMVIYFYPRLKFINLQNTPKIKHKKII